MGTALQRNNRPLPARLHLQKSLEICEEVAGRDPANTASQRALGFAMFRLANLHRVTGEPAKVAHLYARHLAIFRQLASIDPTRARSTRDLAIALRNVGELNLERDQPDIAREFISQAVSILEQVVSDHEDQKHWQADLAKTRSLLAALQG